MAYICFAWALAWVLVSLLGRTTSAFSAAPAVTPKQRLGALSATPATDTKPTSTDTSEAVGMPYDEKLLYMGISEALDKLPVHESLWAHLGIGEEHRNVEIFKISQRPPMFLLKGVLSEDDCDHIQKLAEDSGSMVTAETRRGGNDSTEYRKKSQMAWISNHDHSELERLAKRVQSVFLPFEPFDLDLSVEELQVVKYDTQGEYKYHHDGALRLLTVLYYLNGVSETYFPLADHGRRMRSLDEALKEAALKTPQNDSGVLVSSKECEPVAIERGDAVCFYNYFQDASFEWNAIHGGLPAASTKWIATHWYHHVRRSPSPKQ